MADGEKLRGVAGAFSVQAAHEAATGRGTTPQTGCLAGAALADAMPSEPGTTSEEFPVNVIPSTN